MSPARVLLAVTGLAAGATQSSAQKVAFDRAGYRLSSIGERVLAVARVVDERGRPLSGIPITYRIADPSVATVTPRGEMVARRQGNTFVWAIAGRDSASAIVLVEQLAAKFSFSPPTLRLDAVGAKIPLKIQASDAAGNPLPGGATKASFCRSVNERIASLTPSTGEVTAVANGATYIRCADRGIADSLRIEVQQRPTSVTIASNIKRANKSVGDTFTVKVVGKDRLGKDIQDVRPTWASLNPTVVSVDPVTGKAQSKDNGEARVVAQIGDIADTATISVSGSRAPTPQSQSQQTDVAKDTAATTTTAAVVTPRSALFKVTPVDMNVGDVVGLSVNARDSSGNNMPLSRITFVNADTSVATILKDSLKVVGKKEGSTTIIARLGAFIDTTSINVHIRALSLNKFEEPKIHTDSIALNAKARENILAVIHFDSSSARNRQSRLVLSASALGFMADHSIHTDADVTEGRSGLLKGGEATATLFRYIELSGSIGTGTLTPVALTTQTTTPVGEALTVTEGEANLTVVPVSWLGLRAGLEMRTEQTPLATQSWTIPKVSLVNRFSFVGDVANTYTALSLLPAVSYSDSASKPATFNVAGEAGLELHTGFFRFGVSYYLEHFTFNNSKRIDQFSALRFRLGLSTGRR